MDNLVRGPRVFIAFDEENNERNINVGLISTVIGIRDSEVRLFVNGRLVETVETQIYHGSFVGSGNSWMNGSYTFNFAGVTFRFRQLYKIYGKSELSVVVHAPGLVSREDCQDSLMNYGPLIVHVPERWYEEMRSNEKEL